MSTYKTPHQKHPPDAYDNCPVFLKNYLAYLDHNENRRPATVIEVYCNIRDFCQYIYALRSQPDAATSKEYKKIPVENMALHWLTVTTEEEACDYIDLLGSVCGNAAATISKKILILRNFFQYLVDNSEELRMRLPFGNPFRNVETPKSPDSIAHVLTAEQVQKLLNSTSGTTAVRDKAIIHLLVTSALTLNELVRLNWGDLNERMLSIRGIKDTRIVMLTENCYRSVMKYRMALQDYENSVDGDNPYEVTDKSPMFQSEGTHRRMTGRAVSKRITIAAAAASLCDAEKPITANTLRDTAVAMTLMQFSEAERPHVLSCFGFRGLGSAARFRNIPFAQSMDGDILFRGVKQSPLSDLK